MDLTGPIPHYRRTAVMNSLVRQHKSSYVILVLLFLALACQQKSGNNTLGDDGEGPSNLSNKFDDGGLSNTITNPGAGGSSLTNADKSALNNLVGEFNDVAPSDGTDILSKALAEQMKQLLQDEKNGKDVAMAKMQLAGQMMKECSTRIAELAPRPGQPLAGRYKGAGCGGKGDVFIEIIDPYDRGLGRGVPIGAPPLYKVQGASNGKMTANAQGQGQIEGTPWAGTVSDTGLNGRAAAGTVVNAQFNSTKYGYQSCSMGIGLQNSRNPIPENYIEAMRRAGLCYRQTLFLMSPTMDALFKSMDPKIAQLLRLRMLGLQ